MKPTRWITVAIVLTIVAVGLLSWMANRRGGSRAAEYKAQLRAKGEKITFAELGFPRQPEKPDGLVRLTNAVSKLPTAGFHPGTLWVMSFVSSGRANVSWAADEVMLESSRKRLGWDELNEELVHAADALAEIRLAAGQPVRWFFYDPTNRFNMKFPFVPLRNAAQWLMADTVAALHTNDCNRARDNIHALLGLTAFNRDDTTLVAQMIRVAIAGLAECMTWEALQHEGWKETDLASLQDDWEKVELVKALEAAFLGERAMGEIFFAEIHEHGALRTKQKYLGTQPNATIRARLEALGEAFLWNLSGDDDELLLLRHYQNVLESLRALQRQEAWPVVSSNLQSANAQLQAKLTGPQRFRYPITSVVVPNFNRAFQTMVRNETHRRLTVVALAIKRHQLRHRRYPADLKDLVPEFLSSVPIDPMSGQPLRYRLAPDGEPVLYSIGENAKDDNGDANPAAATKTFDLWSGKDAVWPVPYTGPKVE